MQINNKVYTTKENTGQKTKSSTAKNYVLYRDTSRCDMLAMDYDRPVTLKRALYNIRDEKNIKEGIIGDKNLIERFILDLQKNPQSQKILKRKVVKLAGYGSSAAAFETVDGKIIKITNGNHMPLNRPLTTFDVPVFKKGKSGKTHFYLEEKLYQHSMPFLWVEEVKSMIKKAGYAPTDLFEFDTHQIGISKNGKLYLLDAECAKYKSIFHAIWDKVKRNILKRI